MNHSEKKIILTAKSFFYSFIEILPLGSGSVDPYIFADSDPARIHEAKILRIRI